MSLPWDNQRPAPAPAAPPYTPPQPQPQPQPRPLPPQNMQPDTPPQRQVIARNTQTGEAVNINNVIQQALKDALADNKDTLKGNAENMVRSLVSGKKPKIDKSEDEAGAEAFSGGEITTKTFIQGIALDIGVALVAAVATLEGGSGFNIYEKEVWTAVIPALVVKTIIQTGMSYMMKYKVSSK
jgi:hypothetical protein